MNSHNSGLPSPTEIRSDLLREVPFSFFCSRCKVRAEFISKESGRHTVYCGTCGRDADFELALDAAFEYIQSYLGNVFAHVGLPFPPGSDLHRDEIDAGFDFTYGVSHAPMFILDETRDH